MSFNSKNMWAQRNRYGKGFYQQTTYIAEKVKWLDSNLIWTDGVNSGG